MNAGDHDFGKYSQGENASPLDRAKRAIDDLSDKDLLLIKEYVRFKSELDKVRNLDNSVLNEENMKADEEKVSKLKGNKEANGPVTENFNHQP